MSACVVAALLLSIPLCTLAHEEEDPAPPSESISAQCLEEYHQGHLDKALYYCHGAGSHPEAQYILGKLYALEGVSSHEMNKAYGYFAAAANQHHREAQFMMAICYQNGLGVEQDNVKAAYWYQQARLNGLEGPSLNPQRTRKSQTLSPNALPEFQAIQVAAENALPEAEYQLGLIYSFGHGVPQDDGKAWLWLTRAASKHHQGAQSYLAFMSLLGLGQPDNLQEAIQWFLLASQEPTSEEDNIAALLEKNHFLTRQSAESEYYQGIELLESRLSDQDFQDGLTLIEHAADDHYSPAQLYLAKLYHEGSLIKKDLPQAIHFYKQAADNNSAEAQYMLGWLYFYGEGVEEDHDEAFEWFNRANQQMTQAKEALEFLEMQRSSPPTEQKPIFSSIKNTFHHAKKRLSSWLPKKTPS